MRMLTSGLQTETLATDAASFPVASETCCTTKREDSRDRERVRLPAREHRAEAVVSQDLHGRLAERSGSPYRTPAHAP